MRIRIRTNIKKVERELRRLREKSLDFAYKKAIDQTAAAHKRAILREWRRVFRGRRSFKNVIVINKSKVKNGRVEKPGVVLSLRAVSGIMRKQIQGGRQTPFTGGPWFVPSSKFTRRQLQGKLARGQSFTHDDRVYVRDRRGRVEYVGKLESSVNVPVRFNYDKLLRNVPRRFEIYYLRALRREIKQFHARAARARA